MGCHSCCVIDELRCFDLRRQTDDFLIPVYNRPGKFNLDASSGNPVLKRMVIPVFEFVLVGRPMMRLAESIICLPDERSGQLVFGASLP